MASAQPLDASRIAFRPLDREDLGLLHRWLNTDFVMEWWGNQGNSFEDVVAEYAPGIAGNSPTRGYVILYGDASIGYIQTYMLRDYPDYSVHMGVDEDTAGVDLFIGEREYLHRGLGSSILRTFLAEIVFGTMGAGSCTIDPEPDNTVAIRAYEKAGFRYLKTVQVPAEAHPSYLMQIKRDDLAGGEPNKVAAQR
jgi:RimJ/RimL family protein N-acetyltransferase